MELKYPCPRCYQTRAQGLATSCELCYGKGTVEYDYFKERKVVSTKDINTDKGG